MRQPVKWTLWILGISAALAVLVSIAGILIIPSAWFRDQVRVRMIGEIERVAGSKAEIGVFRFDWKNLTAEVAPFVLHGTEPAGERPLFRADSIKVGLKIISMMKRDIDIGSLAVDAPQVNILVDAEGRTNFPQPKTQSTKDPIEQLLNLAIGRIDLQNGWLQFADRKIPLTLQGENLLARLDYDRGGPSYRGSLAMNRLLIESGKTGPLTFDLDTRLNLYKGRIQLESARLLSGKSELLLSGSIEDFKDPRVNFDVRADGWLADFGQALKLPKPHVGKVDFEGKLSYGAREQLVIAGHMRGSGLAIHEGDLHLNNIGVHSEVHFTPARLQFRGARVDAFGGRFTGMADVTDLKFFKVNGRTDGISLATVTQLVGMKTTPYSAGISGPVELSGTIGRRDLKAAGTFDVTPAGGSLPVSGSAALAFDQQRNTVELGKSYVIFPSSRVDVSGTLGSALSVRLESKDFDDLMPALRIAGNVPEKLPITLDAGGSAVFDGTVNGALNSARVNGSLTLANFEVQKQKIDRLVANIDATSSAVHVGSFALGQEQLRLEGSADATLQNWKLPDAAPVKGNVKLQNASIEKLLTMGGQNLPVRGQLNATAAVDGTAADPRASIKVTIENPFVYGEHFDRVRADVRYTNDGLEVTNGVAELGSARLLLAGTYQHSTNNYQNGRLLFEVSTQGFTLERVANAQTMRPGLQGAFELDATGSAYVRGGTLQPNRLDGALALRSLVVDGRPVGTFTINAKTAGDRLTAALAGNLRGSNVSGEARFQLTGDYPGSGSVAFSPIKLSTLQDLAMAVNRREPLPADGTLEGKLTFSGPVRKPEQMQARLEVPKLQIVPSRSGMTPAQVEELALRNSEPIVVEFDGKAIQIRSAHLVGRETDIRGSGSLNINEKAPWDLRVEGSLNLGVIQDFNQDIVASGATALNVSVRGSLQDPQVVGRAELKGASFSMTDVPNGLDNVTGTVLFDKRRATIEKLTAETGGGTLTLAGFVGFGGLEPSYRLQARADNVRVRYPEGVSTAITSNLTLTGSSTNSILSGVITIRRASFNARTDVGGILASSARPVAAPITPNPYLRGMQLDIRIESAPNLQFQTSLTSDLQAETDLRVRGTAAKPALLGRVVVNQGDVQFFGNKYTINRGEIGFFNPVKVEPVLDMDLETRVRGVLVTINFTGPLNKLNVSYRSDPPLQSTEIVALLAVGRAPGTNSSLASGQTVASQSFLATGTNSLLGQAVTAPISGRLQRFFGVSKLKIDPQLTGINAIPQARLTIEQQVSRDVTLTYITNLAEVNQQIVRLEWDISKNWSVVALREENGAFGVDFFFKKRF